MGPPPATQDRTAFLPTTPIPTVRAEVPRSPARRPRPVEDDPRDYDSRDYDSRDYDSRGSRSRGQIFAGVVLLLALAVSALMYYLTYQTLASVSITSGDSLGGAGDQAIGLGGAFFGALVVFVLAVIAS
ncbi:hypothetical protein BJF90_12720 [Pseudonocardia sp. CNS-004]|nr:hypothetical protein BJF90_12720 [Pseudonocardia sp. CNS-004]